MRISVRMVTALILLASMPLSAPLWATDAAREQRWVDQVVDVIFDGEPVYLEADGHRFLSIYTPAIDQEATDAKKPGRRGMIVLHGTGLHPNWEQVVLPVRVEMPTYGWDTLSVQLPILASNVDYEDYVPVYPEVAPRLQAATDFLVEQGVTDIVIVAHSQGATMAGYYLARTEHEISAFVAIGMSAQHVDPEINSAESLKAIDIPVLDLYGSKDFPSVLATSSKRQVGASHNEYYEQQVIDGAYHFFDDHEEELIAALVQWLEAR